MLNNVCIVEYYCTLKEELWLLTVSVHDIKMCLMSIIVHCIIWDLWFIFTFVFHEQHLFYTPEIFDNIHKEILTWSGVFHLTRRFVNVT